MDTTEKIRTLRSRQGLAVKLTRERGDVVKAHITSVDGDGNDVICTFMDVHEGVERSLSIGEIADIAVE